MPNFQFPPSPSEGEIVQLATGHKYQWENGRWRIYTATLPLNVAPTITPIPPVVSTTPPAFTNNPFWIDPTDSSLFVKVPDGQGGYTWVSSGGTDAQTALAEAKAYTDAREAAIRSGMTVGKPLESESPPALPNANPYWFKPSTSTLHYQFDDGNSVQWIEI